MNRQFRACGFNCFHQSCHFMIHRVFNFSCTCKFTVISWNVLFSLWRWGYGLIWYVWSKKNIFVSKLIVSSIFKLNKSMRKTYHIVYITESHLNCLNWCKQFSYSLCFLENNSVFYFRIRDTTFINQHSCTLSWVSYYSSISKSI